MVVFMKNWILKSTALFLFLSVLSSCISLDNSNVLRPKKTWVVLIEKNNYSSEYSELNNGFENINRLMELFGSLGVPDENILCVKDEVGEQEIKDTFEWLLENADEDAAVFYYIGAHGRFIHKRLRWNFMTPPQWNSLPQKNKVMIVDSCNAGIFVSPFKDEPLSGITYGIVSEDELNWWGDGIEGDPVHGSIWVDYFIEAFQNADADINNDDMLSFSEAHEYANRGVQAYTDEYIFSNEEYLNQYIALGHDPSEKPAYPNAVMNYHLEKELILGSFW